MAGMAPVRRGCYPTTYHIPFQWAPPGPTRVLQRSATYEHEALQELANHWVDSFSLFETDRTNDVFRTNMEFDLEALLNQRDVLIEALVDIILAGADPPPPREDLDTEMHEALNLPRILPASYAAANVPFPLPPPQPVHAPPPFRHPPPGLHPQGNQGLGGLLPRGNQPLGGLPPRVDQPLGELPPRVDQPLGGPPPRVDQPLRGPPPHVDQPLRALPPHVDQPLRALPPHVNQPLRGRLLWGGMPPGFHPPDPQGVQPLAPRGAQPPHPHHPQAPPRRSLKRHQEDGPSSGQHRKKR